MNLQEPLEDYPKNSLEFLLGIPKDLAMDHSRIKKYGR